MTEICDPIPAIMTFAPAPSLMHEFVLNCQVDLEIEVEVFMLLGG